MKKLILIAGIILLSASCKKETVAKTCTYNDEVVDCATMNPISASTSLEVTAQSLVEVDYENSRLNILEDVVEFNSDGSNNCRLELFKVMIDFELSEDQNSLTLYEGDKINTFSRETEGLALEGRWKLQNLDSKYSYSIEFLNTGEMKGFLTCHF